MCACNCVDNAKREKIEAGIIMEASDSGRGSSGLNYFLGALSGDNSCGRLTFPVRSSDPMMKRESARLSASK